MIDAVAAAKAFARDYVAPRAGRWELERIWPREAFGRAAEAGLTGLRVPRERGGSGLSFPDYCAVFEALASADFGFAFALKVHENLAAAIAASGREDLIAAHLPAMLRGARIGAFLLTEPGAGSDAAAIATTARREGEHWVLEGDKAWITNGAGGNLLSVYAQTEPGAGAAGIAAFLVAAEAVGVERLAPYAMMGGHATGAGGFRLRGVRVEAAAMLAAPGEGFRAAMRGVDYARAGVAAMCAGMLDASLAEALRYVAEREAFGAALSEQQGVRFILADVATELHAMRLMADHAARAIERDGAAPIAAAHAKKFATTRAFANIAQCMQVMGAEGYSQERPLARRLAAAKMTHWLDGATEIQNVVIARELFRP